MDGEDKDIFKGFKSWCKKKVVSAFKSNKEKKLLQMGFRRDATDPGKMDGWTSFPSD